MAAVHRVDEFALGEGGGDERADDEASAAPQNIGRQPVAIAPTEQDGERLSGERAPHLVGRVFEDLKGLRGGECELCREAPGVGEEDRGLSVEPWSGSRIARKPANSPGSRLETGEPGNAEGGSA